VVSINEGEYRALSYRGTTNPPEETRRVLERFNSKGYCLKSTLKEIEHPLGRVLDEYLGQRVSDLILQLTQSCNLRCSYCVYSGNYYNRSHTAKRMSKDVAFRAVDFLMEHSVSEEKPHVGFYGGEPFLEFDLMKEVVSYIENKYPDREYRFNLTTNMTLLNDEMIDFIVEKGISLTMSIDGPEKVQNKFRKNAKGEGSFSTVMRNVEKLKLRDPSFFSRCSTNTVISPDGDYEAIYDFLDNNEFLGPLRSLTSTISDQGVKEETTYEKKYYATQTREIFKVLLVLLGEIDRSKASANFMRYEDDLLKTFSQLKLEGTHNTEAGHPGGPCVPGSKRLFVDVQGYFYPCEKMPEQDNFRIGNIFTGFDKEQILKILNVGKYTEEECKKCWAFIQCAACGVTMVEGTEFSRAKRLEKCRETWSAAISRMQVIETLKYYGYDFENARSK